MKFFYSRGAHRPTVFSSIHMKTIILILAAIATMSFAMCLDAQGQRLALPEGQADSRIPLPAQFRVSVEKGVITLTDVNSGKVMGRTTFDRWGVVTPTQDKLRHVALNVTAAVVAGNGSRERIVNPSHKVYTVADHKKGKAAYATMTLEHDVAFVLSSDTQTNGRYEALIENRP
jgi:hypothetical protein